ncbi:hypothetical protein [Ktedonospora formicarum]|uniref:Uncharacterized protein n=1 Tax=Ktedonospora formicarum TaxID=2778364 RepID=A0A8J3I2Z8_9CHLR|nr:hypothetical protein [Ktedonospora formicarum]GHO47826.1 hypothetical protein KSX_59890 [Ktedonospora formicarum]
MQNIPPQSVYPPQVIPQQISRSGGRVALKYGFIAGAILSAISIVVFITFLIPGTSDALYNMFPQALLGNYISLSSTIVSLFVALLNMIVYFFVGLLTARSTGKMGAAMLACLWALLCFLVIDICTYVIGAFMILPLIDVQVQSIISLLISYVFAFMIDLVLALVLGFGAGGLGALIGRQKNSFEPLR